MLWQWQRSSAEFHRDTQTGDGPSPKGLRTVSPLPSAVHDSTDPSSGWSNTILYSFSLADDTTQTFLSYWLPKKKQSRLTMHQAIR